MYWSLFQPSPKAVQALGGLCEGHRGVDVDAAERPRELAPRRNSTVIAHARPHRMPQARRSSVGTDGGIPADATSWTFVAIVRRTGAWRSNAAGLVSDRGVTAALVREDAR